VSSRELIVLGTASQSPTRQRNHNGYLLRWDADGILFDPGEGTQRQFSFVDDVTAAATTRICISHFHGDHCLGLPGVLQRIHGAGVTRALPVVHPAEGGPWLDRLRHASIHEEVTPVVPVPVSEDGVVAELGDGRTLSARRLDHRVPAVGYRLDEPDRLVLDPERLGALGLSGPPVGELRRAGRVEVDGRVVTVDEVGGVRHGQSAALVMDTRLCDGAVALAAEVDLLVCESTFLDADQDLATRYGHMTARQAATLAREAGARLLVLTHFSQRYPDSRAFLDEATAVFPDVVLAEDLARIPVPLRRRGDRPGLPSEA
jgi:ribonuclease Z